MQKPYSVITISWVFIILGGISTLNSFMLGILIQNVPIPTEHLKEAPLLHRILFGNYEVFIALVFIFSTLATASGIYYLQMKKWARNIIEVLTWIMAVYLVSFTILFISSVISIDVPNPETKIYFAVMASVSGLVYGVPLFLILKSVRSEEIKALLN